MKKCPYCAESIQDEAVKCRFCGEFLTAGLRSLRRDAVSSPPQPKEEWYLKNSSIIMAFLCVGPFALPLVWLKPNLNRNTKIIVSIIVLIASYILWGMFIKSLKGIQQYYGQYQQILNQLR